MITTRNLRKVFHVHQKEPGLMGSVKSLIKRQWLEKTALNEVSLQVDAGEIVGLIGANGAGKTTLMKLLAGIIYPTSGDADVLGYKPWERKNEFRRQIALIMGQKAQLWWDLPAADCFLLLKEIYEIPEEQFKAALLELTEALQVEKQMNIQIRRLSLGERMKMELIAALLHRPRVVFLDEPTIGLDIAAQKSIREFLLEYRRRHKPAMIVTSHYMEDIEKLCERIIIIREGQFVYDGSLRAVVREFAGYKIVTAHFGEEAHPEAAAALFDQDDIIESTPTTLKVKAPRTKVAETCSRILKSSAVADLLIEEEDISNVISKLMREKRSSP
jgi:ABC-2 type transport system ATP-binding protein